MVSLCNSDVNLNVRRYLTAKTTSGLPFQARNRQKLANSAKKTRDASGTLMGNRCRAIDW